jgi:NodT family efflux transporter outer membrane factor (OMF) lipoprotein
MRWLAGLSAAALLLCGCDLAPKYKVPVVTVPVSYHDTAIWHAATPADSAPQADWWKAFNDQVLDKLEDQLNAQNFTLAAANGSFQQARAFAAEAEAGLLPQFGVQGGIARTVPPSSGLTSHDLQPNFLLRNTFAGGLSYEVDFWDRVHNQVVAGKASAQASAAELAFVRLSLQAQLANFYLLLRGLDAEQDLLVHTAAAYQEALRLVQTRYTGLIASGMDLSRAQTQLELARAQLNDIRARRALAEHTIATLVAVPAPAFSIPPHPAAIHMPSLPRSLPSTLLQRRPDIAAAEREVAASNALIGVARAAFFPNVSLNAVGGFQSPSTAIFTLPNSFWSFGPGFTLPIFEGGLLRAQEAATIAAFNAATANYRSTVLTGFQDVEDALAQLHYYGAEEAGDRRAVAAAQRTLDLSMALYQDGATNFLEVVIAQESLLGTQQLLLQLQTKYLQAGVQLVRALGGGWTEKDLPGPDTIPLSHVTIGP